MIQVKHISKSFKKHQVINNLSFDLKKGDLIYLQGINGSGKSTLLKIICDILSSDSGEIIKEKNCKIGALIENPSFIENQTLSYNLKFLYSLNNKYYDDSYVKKLCKEFQLDYFSKSKIKSYSVGMRQKLGIIQAIMENQNVILLDEPTRGLDQEGICYFSKLMNQLHNSGVTILIASHDYINEISYTRKLKLVDGVIIEE